MKRLFSFFWKKRLYAGEKVIKVKGWRTALIDCYGQRKRVTFLFLLVILLCGCGGNVTILSWKPTIAQPNGANSTATASPIQPTDISDITGLPTP